MACASINLAFTSTWDVIVVNLFCGENLLRIGFDIAFLFLLLIVADGEVIILALIPFMRVSLTFALILRFLKFLLRRRYHRLYTGLSKICSSC